MKTGNDATVERYLNIYTEGEGDGESDENSSIETVAQNCLMVELSYTPYHLYHTSIPGADESIHPSHEVRLLNFLISFGHAYAGECRQSIMSRPQMVWLLSGNDYKIHMIREDKGSHDYAESSLDKHFPELENIEAIATWIDIHYYKNHTRYYLLHYCFRSWDDKSE